MKAGWFWMNMNADEWGMKFEWLWKNMNLDKCEDVSWMVWDEYERRQV